MGSTDTPNAPINNQKIDPNSTEGANEYSGYVAPARQDVTTTAGPGGFYPGDDPGNIVDRNAIPKTLDSAGTDGTSTSPAGTVSGPTPNSEIAGL